MVDFHKTKITKAIFTRTADKSQSVRGTWAVKKKYLSTTFFLFFFLLYLRFCDKNERDENSRKKFTKKNMRK